MKLHRLLTREVSIVVTWMLGLRGWFRYIDFSDKGLVINRREHQKGTNYKITSKLLP